MEQLKLAWVYRFWVAVGLVVLMPIIGYFVNTRTLAKDAVLKKAALEGTTKTLQTVAGGSLPNNKWADEVTKLKSVLEKDVDKTWFELYERQLEFMVWPKHPKLDFRTIFEEAKVKQETVPPDVLVDYQGAYPAQFEVLYRAADPVGAPASKELVEMDRGVVLAFQAAWVNRSVPPAANDAWAAQEDVWVLGALLDVISKANQDSPSEEKSAIKKVSEILIGAGDKAALDERANSKVAGETFFGPDDAAADPKAAKTPRYVGSRDNRLFKQIPVFLKLTVDQLRTPDVLAEFANARIPMQITQVQFHYAGQRAPRRTAAGAEANKQAAGIAPAKEDEYFHKCELNLWARVFLYEKPPNYDALKSAQAQTPTAQPSPTPEGANP